MPKPVIVEAKRTAVGKRGGALANVRPDHLAAYLLREVLSDLDLDPASVDEVIFGCVDQVGEQSLNIARTAWLAAGLPLEVPAVTLDRQCGSSQTAVNLAAALVQSGTCSLVVAGGVESMSRVPLAGNTEIYGQPYGSWYRQHYQPINQGLAAERIAAKWELSREELDHFSYRSHLRAARAIEEDRFQREILPVPVAQLAEETGAEEAGGEANDREQPEPAVFVQDEGVRFHPDLDAMSELPPVFKEDGLITAGNSSQMSDGASVVIVMSEERASSLGLKPRAAIRSQYSVGVDPELMLTGPIPSTRTILERSGLSLADIDVVEINEAFAPVVLAWEQELHPDMERVNVNGGAIALGHPLGATGAKLMTTLLHELERRDEQLGLQTMCCGGGLGVATLIDRDV